MEKKQKQQEDFFNLYQKEHSDELIVEEDDKEQKTQFKKGGGIPFIGVFIFLLFSAFLAWLGYHFFGGMTAQKEFAFIQIHAPVQSPSGAEAIYTITVENRSDNPLQDTSLLVEFPEGFQFIKSEPEPKNTNKNFWKLGMINSHEKVSISLTGVLIGKQGDEKRLNGEFHYTPAALSSEFIARESFLTTISSSIFNLVIEGPIQSMPEKQVSYRVTYPDFSLLKEREHVTLRFLPPDGFRIFSMRPKPRHELEWDSDILLTFLDAAKRNGAIEIIGAYQGGGGSNKELKAQIGFLRDATFTVEYEQIISTQLLQGNLDLSLFINGTSDATPISFDERISFSLRYENTGADALRDVVLTALFTCSCLDWQTLKDQNGGIFSNGTISWSSKQIPTLALLVPGARGEITFSMTLKQAKQFLQSLQVPISDSLLESFVSASFNQEAAGGSERMEVKSGVLKNPLNSDVSFVSYARYYDDEHKAVGSGPLPPKVSQTTLYRVSWILENTLHELEDILVTGILPNSIEWGGRFDRKAGDVRFDPQTREIIWALNRLPTSVSNVSANFDISLTPQGTDFGTIMPILTDVEFLAKDAKTGARIRIMADALTTSLDGDPIAHGKGLIEE